MTISESRAQYAVAQDLRTQAASAFQELVRAGRDGAIHPIARAAFLGSMEMNALNLKVLADQVIKIDIARHDIATD
jgi:hypothetical protein